LALSSGDRLGGIDLRQLEYFVEIARLGGFRRAAENLSVSQSALSQQMKLLEAELRVPLFERAHRPVRLTEAGETLLARAEYILQEFKSTREEVQAFAGLERGHVRIGTLPAHGAGWTAPMLGDFHRQHPNVELDLAEHNSGVLLELLADRSVDMACLNVPEEKWQAPPGIHLAPVSRVELVLAVHAGHRFGSLEQVSLQELVGEPLILPPHSSIAWIVEEAFRSRGLAHSVRYRITDQRMSLEFVAEGLGIGISTRATIGQHPELALCAIELNDAPLKVVGVAAWTDLGIRNRAVDALVHHVQVWALRTGWRGPAATASGARRASSKTAR
jgi:DNA-binding transcriptional LysR family regulator